MYRVSFKAPWPHGHGYDHAATTEYPVIGVLQVPASTEIEARTIATASLSARARIVELIPYQDSEVSHEN